MTADWRASVRLRDARARVRHPMIRVLAAPRPSIIIQLDQRERDRTRPRAGLHSGVRVRRSTATNRNDRSNDRGHPA